MGRGKGARYVDILVVPDSHAHPDHSNDRYTLLGRFIADTKPDIVVDIGDFGDFQSLSGYDKGKASFEGKRYSKDLAAYLDGQDRIDHEIRHTKKKRPRLVRCLGNHEDRISRVANEYPALQGTLDLKDLQSSAYGWEEHPFLEAVEIEGITFSHYFPTGVSGRPVSGEHQAHSLITKKMTSCVQGHTHTFSYDIRSRPNGSVVHGLVVGCFQDYEPDWTGSAVYRLWRSGLCWLHDCRDGNYDLEWVSMKRLVDAYRG